MGELGYMWLSIPTCRVGSRRRTKSSQVDEKGFELGFMTKHRNTTNIAIQNFVLNSNLC